MTLDELQQHWLALDIRKLPNGIVVAVVPFIFTWAVVFKLDKHGYRIRYCYQEMRDAMEAFNDCDGINDPSGPWIKAKGVDLLGCRVDRSRVPDAF